jgi:hypothetical protein
VPPAVRIAAERRDRHFATLQQYGRTIYEASRFREKSATRVEYPPSVEQTGKRTVPAFRFRPRLSDWLLAVSFFLIGFFSVTGDDPAGRTHEAEPRTQAR